MDYLMTTVPGNMTKGVDEEVELRKELQVRPLITQLIPLLQYITDIITWDSVRELEETVKDPEVKTRLIYSIEELQDLMIELNQVEVGLGKQTDLILKTLGGSDEEATQY